MTPYTCISSKDPDAMLPVIPGLRNWLPLDVTLLRNLWRHNAHLKILENFQRGAVQALVPRVNISTKPG